MLYVYLYTIYSLKHTMKQPLILALAFFIRLQKHFESDFAVDSLLHKYIHLIGKMGFHSWYCKMVGIVGAVD